MPINDWGVSLPPNASYVRDVLKLIVTTNQVDLSYLQVDAPKGAENALAAERQMILSTVCCSNRRLAQKTLAVEWLATGTSLKWDVFMFLRMDIYVCI
jgi:hypothetical protein